MGKSSGRWFRGLDFFPWFLEFDRGGKSVFGSGWSNRFVE